MRSLGGYFHLVDYAKLQQTLESIGFSLRHQTRCDFLKERRFGLLSLEGHRKHLMAMRASDRRLKLLYRQQAGSWPETGFGEINGDLLEADLWLEAGLSTHSVIS